MSLLDISLLSLSEIFGDSQYKVFARTGTKQNFIGGTLGYVAVVYFLIRSLKIGNILWVNGMWDGVSAVLESVFAYLILGERLNRPMQYGGLGFIIAGLFMMRSGGIAK